MADISPIHVASPADRSWASRVPKFIAHRWPTVLGLLFMAFCILDRPDGRSQAHVVFLAALIYLSTAVVGRPGVVWILFAVSVAAVGVLGQLDIDHWPALFAGAVSIVILSLVSDLPRRSGLAALQIPLMLIFGAAVFIALSLSPDLGAYLVAAALMGHATLDVIVWRAGKVVTRSLAEFCAVLDFSLGAAIIVLHLTT